MPTIWDQLDAADPFSARLVSPHNPGFWPAMFGQVDPTTSEDPLVVGEDAARANATKRAIAEWQARQQQRGLGAVGPNAPPAFGPAIPNDPRFLGIPSSVASGWDTAPGWMDRAIEARRAAGGVPGIRPNDAALAAGLARAGLGQPSRPDMAAAPERAAWENEAYRRRLDRAQGLGLSRAGLPPVVANDTPEWRRDEAQRFAFGLGPESGLGPARNDAGAPAPQLFAGVGMGPASEPLPLGWGQRGRLDVFDLVGGREKGLASPDRATQLAEVARANRELAAMGSPNRQLLRGSPGDREGSPAEVGARDATAKQRRKVLKLARKGAAPQEIRTAAEGLPEDTKAYALDLADRIVAARTKGLWRGAYREAERGNIGPLQDMQMERAKKMFGENGGGMGPQFINPALARTPQQAAAIAQHNAIAGEFKVGMERNIAEGKRWDAEAQRAKREDWLKVYGSALQGGMSGDDAAAEADLRVPGANPNAPPPPAPPKPDERIPISKAQSRLDAAFKKPGVVALGISPTASDAETVGRAIVKAIDTGQYVDEPTLAALSQIVQSKRSLEPDYGKLFYVPGLLDSLIAPEATWDSVTKVRKAYKPRYDPSSDFGPVF